MHVKCRHLMAITRISPVGMCNQAIARACFMVLMWMLLQILNTRSILDTICGWLGLSWFIQSREVHCEYKWYRTHLLYHGTVKYGMNSGMSTIGCDYSCIAFQFHFTNKLKSSRINVCYPHHWMKITIPSWHWVANLLFVPQMHVLICAHWLLSHCHVNTRHSSISTCFNVCSRKVLSILSIWPWLLSASLSAHLSHHLYACLSLFHFWNIYFKTIRPRNFIFGTQHPLNKGTEAYWFSDTHPGFIGHWSHHCTIFKVFFSKSIRSMIF